jgi:hypothetical protein
MLREDCVQGWSHMAVTAFGAEGTDGCTPVTKVQESQERAAPAGNVASGSSSGTGETPGVARYVRGGIALRRRRRGDPGHVAATDM